VERNIGRGVSRVSHSMVFLIPSIWPSFYSQFCDMLYYLYYSKQEYQNIGFIIYVLLFKLVIKYFIFLFIFLFFPLIN